LKYRLDPHELLDAAVRKLAAAQLDKALDRVERDPLGEETIHRLRTDCKKLRALLRLVRDGMPERYGIENVMFRDTARLLAGLRDAGVVLRTHDALMESFGAAVRIPAAPSVRERLRARVGEADAPDALERVGARVSEAARRLRDARRRVEQWRIAGSDQRLLLYRGMKRTYKRARRARAAALDSADPRRFHEWRKRVKYHWYQLRLVSALADGAFAERTRRMGHIAQRLGEAHDLAVYAQHLHELGGRSPGADFEALLALAAYRRAKLERAALERSAVLFEDKPKGLLGPLSRRRAALGPRARPVA
jgi:CHAD domain-containing protein